MLYELVAFAGRQTASLLDSSNFVFHLLLRLTAVRLCFS